MDLIQDYTPYTPSVGVQQVGVPLQPRHYSASGVGPRLVTNYKKALWPENWDKEPLNWLRRWQKVWHYYGIYTPEQIAREFSNPSKLLTFAILAADTESEDYMSRYCGLTDDFRSNVHAIVARSMPINRYASALWDPRFDPNVGYALIPSVDDPRFMEKLTGSNQRPYERSSLVKRQT